MMRVIRHETPGTMVVVAEPGHCLKLCHQHCNQMRKFCSIVEPQSESRCKRMSVSVGSNARWSQASGGLAPSSQY